jgi:hypothetical protein
MFQEVAPELAVAVAIAMLLAVFLPHQHQGHARLAKLDGDPLPVRHWPCLRQRGPPKQQSLHLIIAHLGDVGVADPGTLGALKVIAHRRLRHSDR